MSARNSSAGPAALIGETAACASSGAGYAATLFSPYSRHGEAACYHSGASSGFFSVLISGSDGRKYQHSYPLKMLAWVLRDLPVDNDLKHRRPLITMMASPFLMYK